MGWKWFAQPGPFPTARCVGWRGNSLTYTYNATQSLSDPRNQYEQQVQRGQPDLICHALSRAELSSQPHQAHGVGEIQGGSMEELQGVEVKWFRERD